jgi:hypothetical protein
MASNIACSLVRLISKRDGISPTTDVASDPARDRQDYLSPISVFAVDPHSSL